MPPPETSTESAESCARAIGARLLGPVGLTVDGRPLPESAWPRRAARSLLLRLLLDPDHALPRDRILEDLWPELPPEAADRSLRKALHALRRVLEPDLRSGRGSAFIEVANEAIAVRPSVAVALDVNEFGAALDRAARSAATREASLAEALALYRGHLLAEEPATDWAAGHREHLRRTWRRAVFELVELRLAAGSPRRAIPDLERLVEEDPGDEAALRALLGAFAAAGLREDGLARYRVAVDALRGEFGVEPSDETARLAQTLLLAPPPPLAAPAAAAAAPGRLPAPPTPLIGRGRELERLHDLLADPDVRLITITGAGGIGKSRLALEAARHLASEFAGGAWFVALAAVRDRELVLPTIARGLGIEVPTDRSPDEVLAAALRGRDVLLVLDNIEQIDGAAGEIVRLLAGCESVTVLATSREPLHLRAEHEVAVPPLAVPPAAKVGGGAAGDDSLARYEAVALFLQRARAVRPEAVTSRPALAAVATLCGRLDGLPLAIELAAARVRELTPEAMLAGLGDRLGLLAGGYRDLPARQRTMRDAIAWSHDLLSADEQRVFRRLSAFVGGGSLEGAAAVVGAVGPVPDVQAALRSLAAKHLIALDDDGDPPRFAIWETIRDYAAEQLEAHGESRAAGAAHFAHHLGLAEEAGPHLAGADAGRWLERLEPDRDNVRAALAWGLRDDPEGALQLSRAVARYWDFGGYQREGDRWMRRVLAVATAPTIERARVLNEAGWIASSLGDLDRSMTLFQESLAIWQAHGDRIGAIRSLGYLGMGAGERGNVAEAVSYHAASLAMAREEGDARLLSIVLINAAEAALAGGDDGAAAAMLGEALAIAREAGDLIHTADALSDLAGVVLWQGDAPRAIALVREAIALHRDHRYDYGLIRSSLVLGAALVAAGERCEGDRELAAAVARCRELGYKRDLALGLFSLAEAAETVEEGGRAAPRLAEALALVREVGDQANLARGLEGAARLLVGRGEDVAAVLFGAAAAAVRAATGALPAPSWRAATDRRLAVARGRLGGGAFADAWAQGQARPVDAVAAEAQRVLADGGHCPR